MPNNKVCFLFLLSRLAAVALALPAAAFSTAILASGTVGPTVCEVGACPQSDTQTASLGVGQSSANVFDFTYTFNNGDEYLVEGLFANSYDNNGSHLNFSPNVIFLGNNGNPYAPSVGFDILSLTMLQNFYDPEVSPWDGNACEHFPITLAAGTAASATLSYSGIPIGTINATGPGYTNQSMCNYLTFSTAQNASDYLDSSFNLTFYFAPNLAFGTEILTPTPEPSSSMVLLFFFVAAALLSPLIIKEVKQQ